jgi:Tfp pilus assembly PilM family ATPase
LKRRAYSWIGVEVGPRAATAVQLVRRGAGWRVAASAWCPRAAPGAPVSPSEALRFREVLERHGFHGREVVLAAPGDHLLVTPLDLPPRASGAPLERLARMELSRVHKLDVEAMEVALWDFPGPAQASGGASMMVAGLPHADSEAVLRPFDAAGFDVVALEPRVCAVCRAASPVTDPARVTGVIDLDEAAAMLSVLHRGEVAYVRVMPDAGIAPLRAALSQQLGVRAGVVDLMIDPPGAVASRVEMPEDGAAVVNAVAQAVAQEARAAVEYVSRRCGAVGAETVLATGLGVHVPGILGHLAEAVGVKTRIVAPCDALGVESGASSDPTMTAATGLAMHEE